MEYKREAFEMVKGLVFSIAEESIKTINRANLVMREDVDLAPVNLKNVQTNKVEKIQSVSSDKKYGRNEKVVLEKNGLKKTVKWKHADILVKDGWVLIS